MPEMVAAAGDTTTSTSLNSRRAKPKSNGVSSASTPPTRASFMYHASAELQIMKRRDPVTPLISKDPSSFLFIPTDPPPSTRDASKSVGYGETASTGNGDPPSTRIRPRRVAPGDV